MSIINENYLRPFTNHKGLPELYGPMEKLNGKFERIKDNKWVLQYQPSDHPDWIEAFNLREYDPTEMLYTVNKQFFRSDNFDNNNPGLLTVGCSHTYGIGLRDSEVWARKLADKVELPLWNIGVGGIGPEMCLLLTKQFLLSHTPKAIVIQWPSVNRKLLVEQIYAQIDDTILNWITDDTLMGVDMRKNTRRFHSWTPNDPTPEEEYFQKTAKGKLMSSASWGYDFWSTREQFILLAEKYNLPLVEIQPTHNSFDNTASIYRNCTYNIPSIESPWNGRIPQQQKARDNMHFGADVHTAIAEELFELLDKEL